MDDESRLGSLVKWGLGGLGLGSIAIAVTTPTFWGIMIAAGILLLGVLLFGGYFFWQRRRARRQREQFIGDIEKQTAAAPRVISDPKQRADLDKVRSKFQTGLQEFKSRGKDIYKLPWFVIIGESGSGKTEAIRHSEIDFPPGLNKEHQGTGGTVNMDWWFTNRGVILDTAGSMVFPEAGAGQAPEWQEFLRLLKKARPQCPINGLFLVLSIESLIRDSAEKIGQKASRLAQHLDLIQRILDVRFPVYLLVTKADLLTGFREFFDSIEDPLLQHQIFGWSNPDPLDAPFRPDLVDQHLGSVADRLRRRRLALLRETAAAGRIGDTTAQFFSSSYQLGKGPAGARRLDEVDAMFALPESLLRLAPRLRRYLENIFVAGEWSAKPVFLRGIYFTSSMREGKALDEAISFATGLPLDQLPDDRTWEKNRAFFLRDLFHEKVFRESGLVTRATNTLKLLRQRQMAIFGTAGTALLVFLIFVVLARNGLHKSVGREKDNWNIGAANWKENAANPKIKEWTPGVPLRPGGDDPLRLAYAGTNLVPEAKLDGTNLDVISYQAALKGFIQKKFHVPLIFLPVEKLSKVEERPAAQAAMFEGGILRPLVTQTRNKMQKQVLTAADPAGINRHREALLALIQLEADKLSRKGLVRTNAEKYLRVFISYLTDTTHVPDASLVDTFIWTYTNHNALWPPPGLLGGDHLASNPAIDIGLKNFRAVNQANEGRITNEVESVDKLVGALAAYRQAETQWLAKPADLCSALASELYPAKEAVERARSALPSATNSPSGPFVNLTSKYQALEKSASGASGDAFKDITYDLSVGDQQNGIIWEILDRVKAFGKESANLVSAHFGPLKKTAADIDATCFAPLTNSPLPAYQFRWRLYTNACAVASQRPEAVQADLGNDWARFRNMLDSVQKLGAGLAAYKGPLADAVANACSRISQDAEARLRDEYLKSYVSLATGTLAGLPANTQWNIDGITSGRGVFEGISRDLAGTGLEADQLTKVKASLLPKVEQEKKNFIAALSEGIHQKLGFPVLLKSSTTMEVAALVSVKGLLSQVEAELANPAWTTSPECRKAVEDVKARIRLYRSVIDGLVVDGKSGPAVARMKLSAVPEGMPLGDKSDPSFTHIYRYLKLQVGAGKASDNGIDITHFSGDRTDVLIPVGEAGVDEKINFFFNNAEGGSTSYSIQNWGLARFVQKGATTEDGKSWRFHIIPTGSSTKGAVFQADLESPLPKTWLEID